MSEPLKILSKLGCTNHYCMVHEIPKGGMGTNSSCNCLRDAKPHEINTIVRLKNQYIKELQAKVDKLENRQELKNLLRCCTRFKTERDNALTALNSIAETAKHGIKLATSIGDSDE